MKEYIKSDECDYCVRTYYEYDTGYTEYGCSLVGENKFLCYGGEEGCPLSCKYEIEE